MIVPAPFPRRALACVCALALVAPLSGAPSPAYPMTPPTLRDLVTDSDLVVWARVESRELLPPDPSGSPSFTQSRATLVVAEAYKGAVAPGDRVEVTDGTGYLCDAPPRYRTGEHVLAFVEAGWGEWSGQWWTTTGTAYGTRSGALEAVREWGVRIAELEQIEQLATLRQKRAATCEWITRLIEGEATAHQAWLELTRDPDEDSSHASPRFRFEWLGPRQLERVRFAMASREADTPLTRWLERRLNEAPGQPTER